MAIAGCSQPSTQQWKKYGGEITQTVATPLTSVVKEANLAMNDEVFVEATIDGVCEHKGYWIVVKDGNTQNGPPTVSARNTVVTNGCKSVRNSCTSDDCANTMMTVLRSSK